jgi:hypothetical protein
MWLVPHGAGPDAVIVALHGGGFVGGSLYTHRKMYGHLATAAGVRVLFAASAICRAATAGYIAGIARPTASHGSWLPVTADSEKQIIPIVHNGPEQSAWGVDRSTFVTECRTTTSRVILMRLVVVRSNRRLRRPRALTCRSQGGSD